MMHHDAITSTSPQKTLDDYFLRLEDIRARIQEQLERLDDSEEAKFEKLTVFNPILYNRTVIVKEEI